MKAAILLTVGTLWLTPGIAQNAPIEERMSAQELQQSGLHKLTDDELEFLNDWLAGKREVVIEEAQREVREAQMGLRTAEPERVVVESRIDGEFSGWSGRTRFKLANGQVWEQIGGGTYYHRAEDPAVRIEPKSMGSWKLYVEGVGRGVKVKRIK